MLKLPYERPEILPQLPVSRIYLRKVFSNEMMILHVFGDVNDTSLFYINTTNTVLDTPLHMYFKKTGGFLF